MYTVTWVSKLNFELLNILSFDETISAEFDHYSKKFFHSKFIGFIKGEAKWEKIEQRRAKF